MPNTNVNVWNPVQILGIEGTHPSYFNCVGTTTRRRRCYNQVARSNFQHGIIMLERLPEDLGETHLRLRLVEIAERLLCRRNHQDQVDRVAERWMQMIEEWRAERLMVVTHNRRPASPPLRIAEAAPVAAAVLHSPIVPYVNHLQPPAAARATSLLPPLRLEVHTTTRNARAESDALPLEPVITTPPAPANQQLRLPATQSPQTGPRLAVHAQDWSEHRQTLRTVPRHVAPTPQGARMQTTQHPQDVPRPRTQINTPAIFDREASQVVTLPPFPPPPPILLPPQSRPNEPQVLMPTSTHGPGLDQMERPALGRARERSRPRTAAIYGIAPSAPARTVTDRNATQEPTLTHQIAAIPLLDLPPARRRYERLERRLEQLINNECPICSDEFTQVCETPCGHLFCTECAYRWCVRHRNCPTCRQFTRPGMLVRIDSETGL